MNEWPENLSGLDLNPTHEKPIRRVAKLAAIAVLFTAGFIGLAYADVPVTEATTHLFGLLDWSGLYADGAQGGFDAAGVGLGNW
jgi:hypothetical protein